MKPSLRFWGYLNMLLGGVNGLLVLLDLGFIINGHTISMLYVALVSLNGLLTVTGFAVGRWLLRRAR